MGEPLDVPIADSKWVAVRRCPDGRSIVTIKWALTRWILLAGFLGGAIFGFLLGQFT